MSSSVDRHIIGLSPRARRLVVPVFAIAIAIIAVGTFVNRDSEPTDASGPVVGGDLHAVSALGSRLFVSGHAGAGYRASSDGWTQIATLEGKDVMGWTQSGRILLAGGHGGLYISDDDGTTFASVPGLPLSDVHGLGGRGSTVYLASPEAGVLVSVDGGKTFVPRSDAGRDFMGSIWVDPSDPDVAIAPSMQDGAVRTSDGGRTWAPLGSPSGSMAVAVDSTGTNLVALDSGGAQQSADGGQTWTALAVPEGTAAASYTAQGDLVVAARTGDRANVFRQTLDGWDPVT